MALLTLPDLSRIMLEFQDNGASGAFDDRSLDAAFCDLGHDSLSLLQTAGRIEREYDVVLDRFTLAAAHTPRAFLDAVNDRLTEVAA
ncbi:acyl carrier protein [Streptomyces sp. DSM 42041]|uniref:Acyl carrier protein n=1 Tax=Streptomyces hazeniae TaxID=3075538 RepID=A0ABU2NNW1_9ACTN|nr:acyl carrier protein [Streptomyces sp. DSM 42041]MDT0378439.1 acyl carrier protein [Streptomyces sp. DSM 42041]